MAARTPRAAEWKVPVTNVQIWRNKLRLEIKDQIRIKKVPIASEPQQHVEV